MSKFTLPDDVAKKYDYVEESRFTKGLTRPVQKDHKTIQEHVDLRKITLEKADYLYEIGALKGILYGKNITSKSEAKPDSKK